MKRYVRSVGYEGLISHIILQADKDLKSKTWWRREKAERFIQSDTFLDMARSIKRDGHKFRRRGNG